MESASKKKTSLLGMSPSSGISSYNCVQIFGALASVQSIATAWQLHKSSENPSVSANKDSLKLPEDPILTKN